MKEKYTELNKEILDMCYELCKKIEDFSVIDNTEYKLDYKF